MTSFILKKFARWRTSSYFRHLNSKALRGVMIKNSCRTHQVFFFFFLICTIRFVLGSFWNACSLIVGFLQKEKDLELAAQIGQQLLGRNRALEEKVCSLEMELSASSETVVQLRHQVQIKSNLLELYTMSEADGADSESGTTHAYLSLVSFKDTVKAPNFGPHGNFGPLFQNGLLSLKRVLQKNEENKSCRNTSFIFRTWFIPRSYRTCKKKSKVSMRSKVRGFYGIPVLNFNANLVFRQSRTLSWYFRRNNGWSSLYLRNFKSMELGSCILGGVGRNSALLSRLVSNWECLYGRVNSVLSVIADLLSV